MVFHDGVDALMDQSKTQPLDGLPQFLTWKNPNSKFDVIRMRYGQMRHDKEM